MSPSAPGEEGSAAKASDLVTLWQARDRFSAKVRVLEGCMARLEEVRRGAQMSSAAIDRTLLAHSKRAAVEVFDAFSELHAMLKREGGGGTGAAVPR